MKKWTKTNNKAKKWSSSLHHNNHNTDDTSAKAGSTRDLEVMESSASSSACYSGQRNFRPLNSVWHGTAWTHRLHCCRHRHRHQSEKTKRLNPNQTVRIRWRHEGLGEAGPDERWALQQPWTTLTWPMTPSCCGSCRMDARGVELWSVRMSACLDARA